MIGDLVSTDVRGKIGAVAWIRDPMRKSGYRESGDRTQIGDLVWIDDRGRHTMNLKRPETRERNGRRKAFRIKAFRIDESTNLISHVLVEVAGNLPARALGVRAKQCGRHVRMPTDAAPRDGVATTTSGDG
jgi:hypothetical protein